MRDLAEKLFNSRCGIMVEKVNILHSWLNSTFYILDLTFLTFIYFFFIAHNGFAHFSIYRPLIFWNLFLNLGLNCYPLCYLISVQDDIAHVELKSVSGGDSVFTKSIFVRFVDMDLRSYPHFFLCLIYPSNVLGWEFGEIKDMLKRTK